jgi:hypothetical protein
MYKNWHRSYAILSVKTLLKLPLQLTHTKKSVSNSCSTSELHVFHHFGRKNVFVAVPLVFQKTLAFLWFQRHQVISITHASNLFLVCLSSALLVSNNQDSSSLSIVGATTFRLACCKHQNQICGAKTHWTRRCSVDSSSFRHNEQGSTMACRPCLKASHVKKLSWEEPYTSRCIQD